MRRGDGGKGEVVRPSTNTESIVNRVVRSEG